MYRRRVQASRCWLLAMIIYFATLTCRTPVYSLRGEGVEGYSLQFRHLEFLGALSAVIAKPLEQVLKEDLIKFEDALQYSGSEPMADGKILRYNQAMQFITCNQPIPRSTFEKASERCSLVHAMYDVIVEASSLQGLSSGALSSGVLSDMYSGNENEAATWGIRVRRFGEGSALSKQKRHGDRTRSMNQEREACLSLQPLLRLFGGRVNLENPDTKLYVFDGIKGEGFALTRRMATGPKISTISPNTRTCVTNTPLCPIASFTMCNVAGLVANQAVLDPYAGSAAILLAAAMLEPTCQTVGIDIAHDGLVNRDDILRDFSSRNLTKPIALLQGDSTADSILRMARDAIGGKPFDVIITDPPYGVRESTIQTVPINALLHSIAKGRQAGSPLLRDGGKLVCFIPCQADQTLESVLPRQELMIESGLRYDAVREQPLNSKLSRWLVSFVCAY